MTLKNLSNLLEKKIDLLDKRGLSIESKLAYLDLYEQYLNIIRDTANNVIEVGACKGGSLGLWHSYFTQAMVYGIDIKNNSEWNKYMGVSNIVIQTPVDAFHSHFTSLAFDKKNIKFDMILCSGPHSFIATLDFIKLYINLLTDNSILILEDMQTMEFANKLKMELPLDIQQYVEIHDLRSDKTATCNIVFIINKTKLD